MENKGQKIEEWNNFWNGMSPESEIRMWDFYGGRQWISKYIPRFGKTLEAGCGLGRYNFYFSRLGIDIEGLDFSENTIDYLNRWQRKYNFNISFKVGDVKNLPYVDSSLRGYISLGVVEHFIEGPQKPIREAFRTLQPGGVAIITTPSISWNILLRILRTRVKNSVKKIIRRKIHEEQFFQYWYRSYQLKKFIEECGLKVTVYDTFDLLYSFLEAGNFDEKHILPGSIGYMFSDKFENTMLRKLGAQSITISIKMDKVMYCFLCGEKSAKPDSIRRFTVPLCNKCLQKEKSNYYSYNSKPRYASKYLINPPIKKPSKRKCEYSDKEYISDELFEDYGFTKNVAPELLKMPEINIELCNKYIQPVWRNRIIGAI